jgi:protein CpxP
MPRTTTTILTTLSFGAALVTASTLLAQGPQTPANPPMGQGMMGGDMQGMMRMMGQMNEMMDACNKMMQSMAGKPGAAPTDPGASPPAKQQ